MSSDSEPDEVPDKNGDDDGSGMSAYERQRQENIARNQAVLASLGLAGGSGLIRPSASSVSDRPPRQPSPPDLGWARQLVVGSRAALLYEGGWWDVVVRTRQPANVRLGQSATYVVEAVGYPGAVHTVAAELLRPRID